MPLGGTVCIGTHDGAFHADDVLAVAILTTIYPDHKIIRSREDSVLDLADILVDVGDVYSHYTKKYDHHMHDPYKDKAGHVYSSAGLIWRHYAKEYLVKIGIPKSFFFKEHFVDLIEAVEANIKIHWIQPIDRADNGVPQGLTPISEVVSSMRPINPEKSNSRYDTLFLETVSMVSHLFKRACFHSADHVIAKTRCKYTKCRIYNNERIVVSDEPIHNYKMFSKTPAHFVICPSEDYKSVEPYYVIRLITDPVSKAFKSQLPKSILGTRYDVIENVLGIKGISFVHNTGFVALADSEDAALALCNAVLDKQDSDTPILIQE